MILDTTLKQLVLKVRDEKKYFDKYFINLIYAIILYNVH